MRWGTPLGLSWSYNTTGEPAPQSPFRRSPCANSPVLASVSPICRRGTGLPPPDCCPKTHGSGPVSPPDQPSYALAPFCSRCRYPSPARARAPDIAYLVLTQDYTCTISPTPGHRCRIMPPGAPGVRALNGAPRPAPRRRHATHCPRSAPAYAAHPDLLHRRRSGRSMSRIRRVCGDSRRLSGRTKIVFRPSQLAPSMSVNT